MNKEDPYRDQAERLRQRIELHKEGKGDSVTDSLPSRSEIHKQKQKKKKTKVKIKYPLIRVLVVFFILLPITIFSVYSYLEDQNNGKTKNASVDNSKFETIDIEAIEQEEENMEDEPTIVEEGTDSESENSTLTPEQTTTVGNDDKNQPSEQETKKVEKEKEVLVEEKESNQPSESTSGNETIVYHKVQLKETLFSIAMKYYQSQAGIDRIKSANNIQGEEIQAGQVLKIPLNNQ